MSESLHTGRRRAGAARAAGVVRLDPQPPQIHESIQRQVNQLSAWNLTSHEGRSARMLNGTAATHLVAYLLNQYPQRSNVYLLKGTGSGHQHAERVQLKVIHYANMVGNKHATFHFTLNQAAYDAIAVNQGDDQRGAALESETWATRPAAAHPYAGAVVAEAELEDTGAGLVPVSAGWFVVNAGDARWMENPGRGYSLPLTGLDEHEAESFFPMLGMAIRVMNPGEPSAVYHWETEQEDFLVLAGRAVLVVEGTERMLEQWDFVHCPPQTRHAFAATGDRPCVLLCASSRQFQKQGPWGVYCADDTAARHNASAPADTQDAAIAYARFPPSRPTPYRAGLLPDQ